MGLLLSKLLSYLTSGGNYKVIIVGLDNAGKTTTLYKLNLGEVVVTQPTIGSNVEEVVYKNARFECWDLGGQESLRQSWTSYYANAHAVILVIDSTDRERISKVKDELERLVANAELKEAPILVFANKQDLAEAMSTAEIAEFLLLHDIKSHEWHIQASCALSGEGLMSGLEWMSKRVK
mmetsp:Transcript_20722/g.51935  ORF Transcript_20722/g.51935 Transcript_20722/m.51935 type:complete len:179 (+) Transcript_20722:135-671(+)